MKSMRPPLVAIFFMTYFHRAGGGGVGMDPSAPLDPVLLTAREDNVFRDICQSFCSWGGLPPGQRSP